MAENLSLTFRSLPMLALAVIAPIALLFLIARERHRIRVARRFVSENLRGVANPLRVLRPYLVGIGLLSAAIALAGPRAGFTLVPVESRESNRVIAIDVSDSMGATDVGASRLDAAKAIAKRIIESDNGRVALVIFESRPEVVAPLTNDETSRDHHALNHRRTHAEDKMPGEVFSRKRRRWLIIHHHEVSRRAFVECPHLDAEGLRSEALIIRQHV